MEERDHQLNPFHPEFVIWTGLTLNLEVSIIIFRGIRMKSFKLRSFTEYMARQTACTLAWPFSDGKFKSFCNCLEPLKSHDLS